MSKTPSGMALLNADSPSIKVSVERGLKYFPPEVRNVYCAAPEMYQWLTAHYAIEEGPGATDRPEYIALKALLAKIKDK